MDTKQGKQGCGCGGVLVWRGVGVEGCVAGHGGESGGRT